MLLFCIRKRRKIINIISAFFQLFLGLGVDVVHVQLFSSNLYGTVFSMSVVRELKDTRMG